MLSVLSSWVACVIARHQPEQPVGDCPSNIRTYGFLKQESIKICFGHALIAMYQALEHLPQGEPEDSKMKKEFNTIIPHLGSKLQQIAGISVLNAFDEERAKGQMQIVNSVGNASVCMHFLGACRSSSWRTNCCWIPFSSLRRKVAHTLRIWSSSTFEWGC